MRDSGAPPEPGSLCRDLRVDYLVQAGLVCIHPAAVAQRQIGDLGSLREITEAEFLERRISRRFRTQTFRQLVARLRDWPDVEWRLVRQGNDDTAPRFLTAFGRDVEQPETQLTFDPTTRRLTAVGGTRKEAKAREALADVLAVLETADEALSGRAVVDLLEGSCPRDIVRAALKLAVKEGKVLIEQGPRNAILHRLRTVQCASERERADSARSRSESECASAPIGRAHSHSQSDGSESSAGNGALGDTLEL